MTEVITSPCTSVRGGSNKFIVAICKRREGNVCYGNKDGNVSYVYVNSGVSG